MTSTSSEPLAAGRPARPPPRGGRHRRHRTGPARGRVDPVRQHQRARRPGHRGHPARPRRALPGRGPRPGLRGRLGRGPARARSPRRRRPRRAGAGRLRASAHLLLAQHSAVSALEAAVRRCAETTRELHAEVRDQAVDLALELAEAILGRELETATDPGADSLRRALATVPVENAGRRAPQPGGRRRPRPHAARRPARHRGPRPGDRPGDALVETEAGVIDAGITTAVARVRAVLGR